MKERKKKERGGKGVYNHMLIKTAMCSRKKWKGVRGRTEDLAFFFFCFLLPSPPFFLFTGAAAPPPSLIFSNLIWISGSRKLSSPENLFCNFYTSVRVRVRVKDYIPDVACPAATAFRHVYCLRSYLARSMVGNFRRCTYSVGIAFNRCG